jgi:hypothetical protein
LADKLDIINWRNQAEIGDEIVYHTGYLANQRFRDVDKIAADAWRLAERGRVCLVQKKLGDGRYEYIAVASNLKSWLIRD